MLTMMSRSDDVQSNQYRENSLCSTLDPDNTDYFQTAWLAVKSLFNVGSGSHQHHHPVRNEVVAVDTSSSTHTNQYDYTSHSDSERRMKVDGHSRSNSTTETNSDHARSVCVEEVSKDREDNTSHHEEESKDDCDGDENENLQSLEVIHSSKRQRRSADDAVESPVAKHHGSSRLSVHQRRDRHHTNIQSMNEPDHLDNCIATRRQKLKRHTDEQTRSPEVPLTRRRKRSNTNDSGDNKSTAGEAAMNTKVKRNDENSNSGTNDYRRQLRSQYLPGSLGLHRSSASASRENNAVKNRSSKHPDSSSTEEDAENNSRCQLHDGKRQLHNTAIETSRRQSSRSAKEALPNDILSQYIRGRRPRKSTSSNNSQTIDNEESADIEGRQEQNKEDEQLPTKSKSKQERRRSSMSKERTAEESTPCRRGRSQYSGIPAQVVSQYPPQRRNRRQGTNNAISTYKKEEDKGAKEEIEINIQSPSSVHTETYDANDSGDVIVLDYFTLANEWSDLYCSFKPGSNDELFSMETTRMKIGKRRRTTSLSGSVENVKEKQQQEEEDEKECKESAVIPCRRGRSGHPEISPDIVCQYLPQRWCRRGSNASALQEDNDMKEDRSSKDSAEEDDVENDGKGSEAHGGKCRLRDTAIESSRRQSSRSTHKTLSVDILSQYLPGRRRRKSKSSNHSQEIVEAEIDSEKKEQDDEQDDEQEQEQELEQQDKDKKEVINNFLGKERTDSIVDRSTNAKSSRLKAKHRGRRSKNNISQSEELDNQKKAVPVSYRRGRSRQEELPVDIVSQYLPGFRRRHRKQNVQQSNDEEGVAKDIDEEERDSDGDREDCKEVEESQSLPDQSTAVDSSLLRMEDSDDFREVESDSKCDELELEQDLEHEEGAESFACSAATDRPSIYDIKKPTECEGKRDSNVVEDERAPIEQVQSLQIALSISTEASRESEQQSNIILPQNKEVQERRENLDEKENCANLKMSTLFTPRERNEDLKVEEERKHREDRCYEENINFRDEERSEAEGVPSRDLLPTSAHHSSETTRRPQGRPKKTVPVVQDVAGGSDNQQARPRGRPRGTGQKRTAEGPRRQRGRPRNYTNTNVNRNEEEEEEDDEEDSSSESNESQSSEESDSNPSRIQNRQQSRNSLLQDFELLSSRLLMHLDNAQGSSSTDNAVAINEEELVNWQSNLVIIENVVDIVIASKQMRSEES